jgi:hypothetical protein
MLMKQWNPLRIIRIITPFYFLCFRMWVSTNVLLNCYLLWDNKLNVKKRLRALRTRSTTVFLDLRDHRVIYISTSVKNLLPMTRRINISIQL